jgi:aminopeptidase N
VGAPPTADEAETRRCSRIGVALPGSAITPRRKAPLRTGTLVLVATMLAACADRPEPPDPAPGVPRALAEQRARTITDLRYDIRFDIPATRDSTVTGEVTAHFTLADTDAPLVLDFRAPPAHVLGVRLDGDSVPWRVVPDHVVIPARALSPGPHAVTVRFRSTDDALNRGDDFLYALFVPDRASTAFPVFEQPDLKARWTVTLTVPAAWEALANGALVTRDSGNAARHLLRFAETEPLSSYLVSFAAGRLAREEAVRDGRTFTMYHRETDAARVARNREAIFDLHATALRWLEAYTGIAYPFGQFAFLAVPAFQFGGMEHPGAIWYRAESLFLDESASRPQLLGRASLIAHETAHMWFGDLVTMRWFDDVWMKEVFANFMAAKIAGPTFPDINLPLRFFQAHHPTAYGVDRTAGANPIRQPLENLREAGSLYGAIIYQKAPVVMRQLEELVGEETLREGLRRYLDRHRFGNATWPELIAILDELVPDDLASWSRTWVEAPGRPRIRTEWVDSGLVVSQQDDVAGRGLRWTQPVVVALGILDTTAPRGAAASAPRHLVELHRVALRDAQAFVPLPGAARPAFLLAGADGIGYGRFELDSASRSVLLSLVATASLADPVHRAVAWQALWEELLDGTLPPAMFLDAAVSAVEREPDELVGSQVQGLLRGAFWRFVTDAERRAAAPRVEAALWRALDAAPSAGRKGAIFSTLTSVTLTPDGIDRLSRIWRTQQPPRGLPLAEPQYVALAEALALRGVPDAEAILDAQAARITNPDRQARFAFVRPAFSADPTVRDALFRRFGQLEDRRRESWVLDAMGAIHHPLRADASRASLRDALELTAEIQRTGDIFFPLRWLNATLDGHQSAAAAEVVVRYLAEHPELPPRLRGKVLQAADDLFRAARIVDGWTGVVPET